MQQKLAHCGTLGEHQKCFSPVYAFRALVMAMLSSTAMPLSVGNSELLASSPVTTFHTTKVQCTIKIELLHPRVCQKLVALAPLIRTSTQDQSCNPDYTGSLNWPFHRLNFEDFLSHSPLLIDEAVKQK